MVGAAVHCGLVESAAPRTTTSHDCRLSGVDERLLAVQWTDTPASFRAGGGVCVCVSRSEPRVTELTLPPQCPLRQ